VAKSVVQNERIYPNLRPIVHCIQIRPQQNLRVLKHNHFVSQQPIASLMVEDLKVRGKSGWKYNFIFHATTIQILNYSFHTNTLTSPLYSAITPVGPLSQLFFPSNFAGKTTDPLNLLFLVYSKTVAAIFSKTSVTAYQSTCCYIPEDCDLHALIIFAYHIVCLRTYYLLWLTLYPTLTRFQR